MKTRKLKKLTLNRETLSHLDGESLKAAVGVQGPTTTQACSYCVSCASFCAMCDP